MTDEIIYKCGSCDEEAIFLDLSGMNLAYPTCATCLGDELITLELEKRRIIPTYEWDNWRKDYPDFRIAT